MFDPYEEGIASLEADYELWHLLGEASALERIALQQATIAEEAGNEADSQRLREAQDKANKWTRTAVTKLRDLRVKRGGERLLRQAEEAISEALSSGQERRAK